MDYLDKMKSLIKNLNSYRNAYYNNSESIITDKEYDDLYDQLLALEKEVNITLSNSPTQTVGYEVKSKLEKVKHSHPMLSLNKTKSVDELKEFINNNECLLMHKLDGLTILLTYENGKLVKAETRGNGEIGEDVTHNAKVFSNIPLTIQYTGKLEVEGEAIITYKDFNYINSKLSEDGKYKNPRNLVSGSVRQLDSKIAKERNIKFIAWKVPYGIWNDSFAERLNLLQSLGFDTVPLVYYEEDDELCNIEDDIQNLKDIAKEKGYPIDGLVVAYDNIPYAESLGNTGHHPKHSLAFKFYDEEVETTLTDIEWSMGKTSTLTPVAIFEPVEIDGTEVSRASLHNISIAKELELGIRDTITVYKANMIIPQIRDNLTRSNTLKIPTTCPICGSATEIKKDNDSEVLICTNANCKGKLLGRLTHFVSKNAINIDGLSEATLEKFIELDWLTNFIDVFYLDVNKKEMYKLDGFGKKSVDKLLENIEKSKNTTLDRFIYSLSIPLIGRTASKEISNYFNGDYKKFYDSWIYQFDFTKLNDFGSAMDYSMLNYLKHNDSMINTLAKEFNFITQSSNEQIKSENDQIKNKTFVITGSVNHFKNRDELKEKIESLGGKVSGSVSAKTNYLINNDTTSQSGKNKKAMELSIPIISEEEFIDLIK